MLLISETVTNAVVHASSPLSVAVDCDGSVLDVRVRDASPATPQQRAPTAYDEDGRGLVLLQRLADHWGVTPLPPGGKEVWFQLRART